MTSPNTSLPGRRWPRPLIVSVFFLTAAVLLWLSGLLTPTITSAEVKMVPASFAEVAAKASPAVVNISTLKDFKGSRRLYRPYRRPNEPDDFFEDFFERFFRNSPQDRAPKQKSLGSGFILDKSGLIITNNHVIEGADEITVRMVDEKEYKAKVLGRDPKTDLALIRIEAKGDLPYLTLGDSDQVKVGDWVVAIGNPFGLSHTVTAGILSARGRVIGAGPYDDFLQTDASINLGNSGGPLLNLDGEVIGINTAIVRGGQGIGFAIPSSMAKKIVAQLKDKGRVVRGWLGVMVQAVTPELAKSFKLKTEEGALVADVIPGSPAEKAGFKRGDVIISFNGQKIKEVNDLPRQVADTEVGREVEVVLIREGQEKSLKVVIGEMQEKIAVQAQAGDLGLKVEELAPEEAARMGLPGPGGVIITGFEEDSPAAESGLARGDMILEINREPIKSMSDYKQAVQKLNQGEVVLLLVRRGTNTLFFSVKLD
ncbi:MAG: DegQ family serine endoprotease [Pseudomonadota bacterium]